MSSTLSAGLTAAIAGAVCYGAAPAVQAVAARREVQGEGVGARLTLRLARRPIWLTGMAVGSSRVDLQACKLEYSIVSPK